MPKALSVDPFGRFLYVTNLDAPERGVDGGDHVSVYRIGVNGTLTSVPGSPFLAGAAPLCIQTDPLGRFIYIGNAGAQESDETVSGYRVGGNGTLTRLVGSPFVDKESPQSMAIDPFGRFLYTAGQYDLALLTRSIVENGSLTYLPNSSFTTPVYSDFWNMVIADPLGRFIYQSNSVQGDPSDAVISIYRVSAKGLTPALIYHSRFVSNSMVTDLFGQYLYAAVSIVPGLKPFTSVNGTGIAVYRISGNGNLTSVTGSPFNTTFQVGPMAVSP